MDLNSGLFLVIISGGVKRFIEAIYPYEIKENINKTKAPGIFWTKINAVQEGETHPTKRIQGRDILQQGKHP